MTADNFASILNNLRQLQPFRVFAVELNGGRRFEVDHPGALVVRDGVAVFLAPGGVPIWFDHDCVSQIIGIPAGTQLDDRGASDSAFAAWHSANLPRANQSPEPDEDMLPEYSFDSSKAKPNRFATRLKQGSRAVVLDPDVAAVFSTTESVNAVLRALIETMPQTPST